MKKEKLKIFENRVERYKKQKPHHNLRTTFLEHPSMRIGPATPIAAIPKRRLRALDRNFRGSISSFVR